MNDYIGNATCKNCGNEFRQETPHHIFCSQKCRNAYCKKNHTNARDVIESFTFQCAHCGKEVTVNPAAGDRRYKYCSEICFLAEKQQRKRERKDFRRKIFSSAQSYFSYEKFTNEHF